MVDGPADAVLEKRGRISLKGASAIAKQMARVDQAVREIAASPGHAVPSRL